MFLLAPGQLKEVGPEPPPRCSAATVVWPALRLVFGPTQPIERTSVFNFRSTFEFSILASRVFEWDWLAGRGSTLVEKLMF